MFNRSLQIVLGILSLPVVLQAASPRTAFIFPVFANTTPVAPSCDKWGSRFTVFNPNSSPTVATFTIVDRLSSAQTSNSIEVRGFSLRTVATEALGIGWVKVSAAQPIMVTETIEHLHGCVSAGRPTISNLLSKIDVTPPEGTRRQFVGVDFVSYYGSNTGISIVFPSDAPGVVATGKLIHRWNDGRVVSEKNIVIPANGQLMALITEMLPQESLRFDTENRIVGTVELIFDQQVFITAIQFDAVLEDLEEHLTQSLSTVF